VIRGTSAAAAPDRERESHLARDKSESQANGCELLTPLFCFAPLVWPIANLTTNCHLPLCNLAGKLLKIRAHQCKSVAKTIFLCAPLRPLWFKVFFPSDLSLLTPLFCFAPYGLANCQLPIAICRCATLLGRMPVKTKPKCRAG
jgi:hypothetical protein